MNDDQLLPVLADRGVIDRIVDGEVAVILIGPTQIEQHVAVADLPTGVRDGDWLVLDLDVEPPAVLGVDAASTAHRRAALTRRYERLRARRGRELGC